MLIPGKDSTRLLCFPALNRFEEIDHGVFTRHGGVSHGDLASLNVGAAVGDLPENVRENRIIMARAMNARRLAFVRQVHGKKIAVLDSSMDQGKDTLWQTGLEADAIVTNLPGVFCAVAVADCQPILLYDPENRVVGAVHSGWRGSLQNIAGAAVEAMGKVFGSDPGRIVAGIGPSLGPCCAEFVHYQREIPEEFWPYKDDKDHFDFWAITRDQLTAAGLAEKNISCAGICTKCLSGDFFSYRANRAAGRFAAVIGLKG
ncbi:MAG: peptidoglycan editing factor PgeF [Desulfatibacillum sp.]|nr:peptidoglycan editing factor PgeF [Desulfatibacillum sp.]